MTMTTIIPFVSYCRHTTGTMTTATVSLMASLFALLVLTRALVVMIHPHLLLSPILLADMIHSLILVRHINHRVYLLIHIGTHRDLSVILAMRSWMHLSTSVSAKDVGLPSGCTAQ